jgi:hypothetical protein
MYSVPSALPDLVAGGVCNGAHTGILPLVSRLIINPLDVTSITLIIDGQQWLFSVLEVR